MINSYEIKKQNNKEVLYIYIDLKNDFSSKTWSKNNERIEQKIKKFIKDNKIVFTGTIAVIVVNGLIVGNVFLNQTNSNIFTPSNNFTISEVLENNFVDNTSTIKNNEDVEIQSNHELITEKQINNNGVEKNQELITEKQINNNEIKNEQVINQQETKQEQIEVKNKSEKKEDNNIYVNIKRTNGTEITLELEEYIQGVVAAEMPAEFHEQALMAQSIIARTYALKSLSRNQTLSDNESTQSYKDNNELQILWGSKYNSYNDKIKNAVLKTKGIYLTYNNEYIEAVYHSTSNGQTENSYNVWDTYFPYLISVESPYDTSNKSFIMEKMVSYKELSNKLNIEITKDTNFEILDRTEGNRVKTIIVNEKEFTGTNFRNILGLRSADFEITKLDEGIIFKTKGYGHGVGLSQYGANGMAKEGYNYEQILKHYYPGVTINLK